jgi:hypothetical protein
MALESRKEAYAYITSFANICKSFSQGCVRLKQLAMEQQQFHETLNSGKRLSGFYRKLVDQAICDKSASSARYLQREITKLLSNLFTSTEFFKSIGRKCEVDVLITYYKTLLCRLDTS